MKLSVNIEYTTSDERVVLYVVRVSNGETNFVTSLERQKHKYWNGEEHEDVWHCDRYHLCASKIYTVNQVIETLYGDEYFLDNEDNWIYG
jgi:hypothetical protein